MAEYTKNLNLEKPDYEEYYDIGTFNANADKIDKGIEDSEKRSTQRLEVHKDSNDHTADKIRYSGKVGKANVQDAIDEVDTRVGNIVADGGNGNAEVVDARRSTVKDKTFPTLKDRLEDGEDDIEKLKHDTNAVATVEQSSFDSVMPVPQSATKGQVSGVVRGLTATNLIENGDFNKGTESWKNDMTTLINVTNHTLTMSFLRPYGFFWADLTSTPNMGSKIYVRARRKNNGIVPKFSTIYLRGGFSTSSGTYMGDRNLEWQHISDVYLVDSEPTDIVNIAFRNEYETLEDAQQASVDLQDFIAVNLTATFGEGNEPTKEECDKIFTNYFDNTKSTIGSARISSADDMGEVRDRAYVTAIKDNKIVNLRSLPNGVKDEISITDEKMVKKVSDEVVLDGNSGWGSSSGFAFKTNTYLMYIRNWSSDNGAATNLANSCIALSGDGSYQSLSDWDEDKRQITIGRDLNLRIEKIKVDAMPSGGTPAGFKEYLNKYPITLTYQLAGPEIIPVRWTGLQAYENGTIYVDTVIPELGFYYDNGLESHYPDHPIKEVDTLYRVDKETGYREPLDVSKCEIREDKLSFTHPDLVDGDLCDWDYVPMTESTRPETSLTFPTNLKASVNSLLDGEERNKKEHNIFKTRLDNHDRDIERIDSKVIDGGVF